MQCTTIKGQGNTSKETGYFENKGMLTAEGDGKLNESQVCKYRRMLLDLSRKQLVTPEGEGSV